MTDGMRKAGRERPGEVALPATQQRAIALDYATNVAASLQLLQGKWNETYEAGVRHDNGKARWIENWFFATWAYNSGFHPQSEAHVDGNNGAWGVGWLNNPANPNYPPAREMFRTHASDPKYPNRWSYPERVLGWAAWSIDKPGETPDGMGPRIAWWVNNDMRLMAQPSPDSFCDASNDCDYGQAYQPTEPDVSGEPAGPCAHQNSAGQYDLKCWYHQSTSYRSCDPITDPGSGDRIEEPCGHESLRYQTAGEPALTYTEGGTSYDFNFYPPTCTTQGLPGGALIVDDVPASVRSGRDGCGHPWTDAGTFDLNFNEPAGRIDFHQVGAGFGGHFWFAHTRSTPVSEHLQVTGTWRFAQELNQWGRVLVHLPDHGAHTQQAAYKVNLGDGSSKTRYALQRTGGDNKWVSLGVMRFRGTPSVELSSYTFDGFGQDDIAFDAVAIEPLNAKPANVVVALGDSYSSGEGANDSANGDDYYPNSDYGGEYGEFDSRRNACHRSPHAWSRKMYLPGQSQPTGVLADQLDGALDYHLIACSGAESEHLLPYHSVPAGESHPVNGDGQMGAGQFGEVSQLDAGYLDENTNLVTLSIGGNDAYFSDIVRDCVATSKCKEANSIDDRTNDAALRSRIPKEISQSLIVVLEEIVRRAPNATILLMGYPRLVTYPFPTAPCGAIGLIGYDDATWINEMTDLLDEHLDAIVDTKAGEGIRVVFGDPRPTFEGFGACGGDLVEEHVNGIILDKTAGEVPLANDPDNPASQQSFHPNVHGTTDYAWVAEEAISRSGTGG